MAFISAASSGSGQSAPLRQAWTQRPKMDFHAARTLARQRSLEKKARNYKLPLGELTVFTQQISSLLTAGLPLVQIPANDHYKISEIVSLFQSSLAKVKQMERRLADVSLDSIPMCPVCGKMMVLRTHRNGSPEGELYYGCIDNPTCSGQVALR